MSRWLLRRLLEDFIRKPRGLETICLELLRAAGRVWYEDNDASRLSWIIENLERSRP